MQTTANVVNLTPHTINSPMGAIAPSGKVARVASTSTKVGSIGGVDIMAPIFGQTEGLPEYQEGTYLLVSTLVRTANPTRKDLLSPGDAIRNEKGEVTGCKNFAGNP